MKDTILIIDDMELNRDMLSDMLEEDYEILQASDGVEGLGVIDKQADEIRAILLDLNMPRLDGFGVLDELKKRGLLSTIPIVVISGETSSDVEIQCLDYGVADFIQRPFNQAIVTHRVHNVIDLYNYQNKLEVRVAEQTRQISNQYEILQQQAVKLHETNSQLIEVLGNVIELRDLESGEHVKRVKGFTRIMGYQMMKDFPETGLTPESVELIADASALHDIGKIVIPDNVLLKPGKLTPDEFEMIKTHTSRGGEIIETMEGIWNNQEYQKASYEIARHHHERFDGRGYPDHLSGDEIPIEAQLVSVADVYDALVTDRVYKKAFPKDKAFEMIQNGECGTFSPRLMTCFAHAREEMEALADQGKKA